MELAGFIVSMLIAVLLSQTLHRALQRVLPFSIPLPILQIILGALLAAFLKQGISLNPEVFFFVFLPPLLFLDGWRIPKEALRRDFGSIFGLAVVLVAITVLVLGSIIYWLIPAIPLPVAFALAAIVSPTDAVAFSGIAKHLPIPKRTHTILEGEALFNDATGLVAFRLAIAALVTGSFTFGSALLSFAWVAIVGLLVGIIVSAVLLYTRKLFTARFNEEVSAEVLFSLIVPFIAYTIAEHLEASGILAAVSAGITMGRAHLYQHESSSTRLHRRIVWDTLQTTLNGMIFVLLGEQLPSLFVNASQTVQESGHESTWWLLLYAAIICLVLALVRSIVITLFVRLGQYIPAIRKLLPNQVDTRAIAILSLGGVRGALTLAGVMTLPLYLHGAPFPARDLAIFLAAAVILVSLITSAFGLPFALRRYVPTKLDDDNAAQQQQQLALHSIHVAAEEALQNALSRLHEQMPNISAEEAQQHAAILRRVLHTLDKTVTQHPHATGSTTAEPMYHSLQLESYLSEIALNSARDTLIALERDKQLSEEHAHPLIHRLDLYELNHKL